MVQKVEFFSIVLQKNIAANPNIGDYEVKYMEFYDAVGKNSIHLNLDTVVQHTVSLTNASQFADRIILGGGRKVSLNNNPSLLPAFNSTIIFNPNNTEISKGKLFIFAKKIDTNTNTNTNDIVSIDARISFDNRFYLVINPNYVFEIPPRVNYRFLFKIYQSHETQKLFFAIDPLTKTEFLSRIGYFYSIFEKAIFDLDINNNDLIEIEGYLHQFFTEIPINGSNLTTQIS